MICIYCERPIKDEMFGSKEIVESLYKYKIFFHPKCIMEKINKGIAVHIGNVLDEVDR